MAGLEDTWPRTAFSGKCVSPKGHACRIFKPFKRVVHSVSIKKYDLTSFQHLHYDFESTTILTLSSKIWKRRNFNHSF